MLERKGGATRRPASEGHGLAGTAFAGSSAARWKMGRTATSTRNEKGERTYAL
jgi:hypothetical protein